MSEAQARPFSVEPQVMATLCTHLYQVTHLTAVAEIYIEKFGFFGVINTSVGDPDPVGSGPFCRIRIRKFFTGSRIRIRHPPLKVLIIIRKGDFFTTTFSVL
jgi:hypothetical protein